MKILDKYVFYYNWLHLLLVCRFRHPNLITLMRYCKASKMLVYPYLYHQFHAYKVKKGEIIAWYCTVGFILIINVYQSIVYDDNNVDEMGLHAHHNVLAVIVLCS